MSHISQQEEAEFSIFTDQLHSDICHAYRMEEIVADFKRLMNGLGGDGSGSGTVVAGLSGTLHALYSLINKMQAPLRAIAQVGATWSASHQPACPKWPPCGFQRSPSISWHMNR